VSLIQRIHQAWEARAALHEDPELDAYRVYHGWGEGCPGLELDRYGDALLVRYRAHLGAELDAIVAAVDEHRRFPVVIAKARGQDPRALRGELPAEPYVVREHGLRFWIEAHQRGNPGLFLDARPARAWLQKNCGDRRILNLFAFTGSLGIAAAAAGARSVVHIDSQRGMLRRCKANHVLNDLPIDDRDLMRVNLYQHLRKAAAGRRRFGGIIVDPPPLEPRDRTPGRKGLLGLAPLVARMLEPDGWLLCLFHGHESSYQEREDALLEAAAAPLEVMWRGASGIDFPDSDTRWRLQLTAFRRPV
jgi:23S rRNA (cytosine1962-C5)-methyltransferase